MKAAPPEGWRGCGAWGHGLVVPWQCWGTSEILELFSSLNNSMSSNSGLAVPSRGQPQHCSVPSTWLFPALQKEEAGGKGNNDFCFFSDAHRNKISSGLARHSLSIVESQNYLGWERALRSSSQRPQH